MIKFRFESFNNVVDQNNVEKRFTRFFPHA